MVGLTSLTSDCSIYVYVEENNIHEENKIAKVKECVFDI